VCGTVTADDLRITAAKQIKNVLPMGEVMCGSCARSLGPRAPIPTDPEGKLDAQACSWLALLRKHLIRARVRVRVAELRALATRLAAVGPTTDPDAVAVYEQIRVLLLTPRRHKGPKGHTVMRISHLREALKSLGPTPQALLHVAAAMKAWRRITGREVNRGERFRADTVVASMLAVPAPAPYIQHLHTKGLSNLALMFHPNTLEHRKKDAAIRGIFSGSGDYMQRTADQLSAQIIKD
ncbi:hypothetical protein LCGC14_3169520, partial [marine sediment metagenome]